MMISHVVVGGSDSDWYPRLRPASVEFDVASETVDEDSVDESVLGLVLDPGSPPDPGVLDTVLETVDSVDDDELDISFSFSVEKDEEDILDVESKEEVVADEESEEELNVELFNSPISTAAVVAPCSSVVMAVVVAERVVVLMVVVVAERVVGLRVVDGGVVVEASSIWLLSAWVVVVIVVVFVAGLLSLVSKTVV